MKSLREVQTFHVVREYCKVGCKNCMNYFQSLTNANCSALSLLSLVSAMEKLPPELGTSLLRGLLFSDLWLMRIRKFEIYIVIGKNQRFCHWGSTKLVSPNCYDWFFHPICSQIRSFPSLHLLLHYRHLEAGLFSYDVLVTSLIAILIFKLIRNVPPAV